MRDKRFKTVHRGGLLTGDQHRKLMLWACACVEHVFSLESSGCEKCLVEAISIAELWTLGGASVGEARKASVGCIDIARELSNPVSVAIARATGHAVATAHMADHSLRAAWYSLKAVKQAGKSIEMEWSWQIEQLPEDLKTLVSQVMAKPK